jgi:hypothetical protein
MTNEDFEACTRRLNTEADSILRIKGPDYAGHGQDNRLANFETIAELLKGAPIDAMTVAAIYWLKHVFAICTFVRTRKEGSEPMLGRWADERNYNALTFACFQDLLNQKPKLVEAKVDSGLGDGPPFNPPQDRTGGGPTRPSGETLS